MFKLVESIPDVHQALEFYVRATINFRFSNPQNVRVTQLLVFSIGCNLNELLEFDMVSSQRMVIKVSFLEIRFDAGKIHLFLERKYFQDRARFRRI